MRLILNGKFLAQPATGVQRFALEVGRELAGIAHDVRVAVPGEPDVVPVGDVVGRPHAQRSAMSLNAWEQLRLPRLLQTDDVLLSLGNTGPVTVRRQVIVVHDVAPMVQPAWFSRGYRFAFRQVHQRAIHNAAVLATVSERSRQDIVRLGLAGGRSVRVVGNGVRPPSVELGADRRRSFVFVGAHDVRKNFAFAERVHQAVLDQAGDVELVVTSRSGVRANLAAASGGRDRVRWLVDPSDQELWRELSTATALLFPSHYEGFGLPLLEASAVGTPFLSGPVGAAAELAVSPVMLQPLDVEAWAEQLLSWLEVFPADLSTQLRGRAGDHSWTSVAQRLLEAAEEVGHV